LVRQHPTTCGGASLSRGACDKLEAPFYAWKRLSLFHGGPGESLVPPYTLGMVSVPQGPGRKPGASAYTRKRLSLMGPISLFHEGRVESMVFLCTRESVARLVHQTRAYSNEASTPSLLQERRRARDTPIHISRQWLTIVSGAPSIVRRLRSVGPHRRSGGAACAHCRLRNEGQRAYCSLLRHNWEYLTQDAIDKAAEAAR
jgi:hypothetical protein